MSTVEMNDLIQSKNYAEIGNFFSKALPGGNAVEFLEHVIESLSGGHLHKKSKSSPATETAPASTRDVKASYVLNDAIDDLPITLGLQLPEDMTMIAYIIGAKGINVISIGKSSNTRLQLEKVGTRGADQFRHIFISGSVKNVIHAYQTLHEHILRKDPAFPEITRMIVPNEVVAHIIGKGGVLIKELSNIACIQRIDIQQEIEMNRMTNGYYGRSVIVSGEFMKRLHVVYLLLRQLVQDKSLPSNWNGDTLNVIYPQGFSGGSSYSNFNPQGGAGLGMGGGSSYMGSTGGQGQTGGQGLFFPAPRDPVPLPRGQPVYANTIKVDVQVPSDKACLGHIIGPKGVFIVEMERSSMCQIKIEKEFVEGTNPAERKVSVSGSNMVQISQAVELINRKVDEWRQNYTPGSGPFRAPDEPKPYWDTPKAASGFGSYPTQQYPPQSQYPPVGGQSLYPPHQSAPSQYPPHQGVSGGQSQYASNQGASSQYPPNQGAAPGQVQGLPYYQPHQ